MGPDNDTLADTDNKVTSKPEAEEKLTQTDLLALGFTKKLIAELLPQPEVRKSKMYRNAFYYLWRKSDVDAAMQDHRFLETMSEENQAKKAKRSQSAKKAMAKRRAKTYIEVNKVIKRLSLPKRKALPTIQKLAIDSRRNYYLMRDSYEDYEDPANADIETITRWMVNYIRHEMTNYDFEVYYANMKGAIGRRQAFILFEQAVYANIAKVYPELQDECQRQLAMRMADEEIDMSEVKDFMEEIAKEEKVKTKSRKKQNQANEHVGTNGLFLYVAGSVLSPEVGKYGYQVYQWGEAEPVISCSSKFALPHTENKIQISINKSDPEHSLYEKDASDQKRDRAILELVALTEALTFCSKNKLYSNRPVSIHCDLPYISAMARDEEKMGKRINKKNIESQYWKKMAKATNKIQDNIKWTVSDYGRTLNNPRRMACVRLVSG